MSKILRTSMEKGGNIGNDISMMRKSCSIVTYTFFLFRWYFHSSIRKNKCPSLVFVSLFVFDDLWNKFRSIRKTTAICGPSEKFSLMCLFDRPWTNYYSYDDIRWIDSFFKVFGIFLLWFDFCFPHIRWIFTAITRVLTSYQHFDHRSEEKNVS